MKRPVTINEIYPSDKNRNKMEIISETPNKLVPNIPDDWVFFKKVYFNNMDINIFQIDTRDFHCKPMTGPYDKMKVLEKEIRRHPENFLHTPEEIMVTLERLYTESGGNIPRRYMVIRVVKKKAYFQYGEGWEFKYLRIVRMPDGLVVCDKDYNPITKEILSYEGHDTIND
jgi:hypothetical protein